MPVAILHVMMRNGTAFKHEIETEEDPGVLFDTISPWFDNDGAVRRQIINELSNSGRNQGQIESCLIFSILRTMLKRSQGNGSDLHLNAP